MALSEEEAQKKMSTINEAYEVLSDPELKARFDNGDDPNDPQAGQNPFQGSPFGFNPGGQPIFFQQRGGGGGGHQFKFPCRWWWRWWWAFWGLPWWIPFWLTYAKRATWAEQHRISVWSNGVQHLDRYFFFRP
ncbi:hypothetical protein MRB53_038073 [Persea americana]|nr:hypothetical protein MRB53_038073 [Persea americana]